MVKFYVFILAACAGILCVAGQTTLAPEFIACMRSCVTTTQYNPVCGTDNQIYNNRARISCANRCGHEVRVAYLGTCGPSQGVGGL